MPTATAAGKTRVLIVEDDPDARDIYEGTLRFAGYEVTTVGSIAEARRAASVRRPDMVVLDCRLPDGYGTDLLRHWRRNTPVMAQVPVVVITAFSQEQDVQAAAQAGADAFVVKPCSGEALTNHLSKVRARVPTRHLPQLRMSEPRVARAVANPQKTTNNDRERETFHARDEGENAALEARCHRCLRCSPILGRRADEAMQRATNLGWSLQGKGWACPICVERHKASKKTSSGSRPRVRL
jgi:DNA-binding response OmpR family regulator